MGPINVGSVGGGLFPDTPKGRELPIGCTYQFGPGELLEVATPPRWNLPLPDGYSTEWLDHDNEEVLEAGFKPGPAYIKDGRVYFQPQYEGHEGARYLFLRDPEGAVVATWDEGRWWTASESAAFGLTLMVPGVGAIDAYGIGENTQRGDIEWPESDQ